MVQRVRIRGKGQPCVELLFGTCTPKVRSLQGLSGGSIGRPRGRGAIEATSRQSTQLEINGSMVSKFTSGGKKDTNVEGRVEASG